MSRCRHIHHGHGHRVRLIMPDIHPKRGDTEILVPNRSEQLSLARRMALWRENGSLIEDEDEFFGRQEDQDEPEGSSLTFRRHGDHGESEQAEQANNPPVGQGGLSAAEARATEDRFRTIGYHEAYDQSKEERLQEGFEAGYRDSFDAAFRVGEILGREAMGAKLLALKHHQQSSSDNLPQTVSSKLPTDLAVIVRNHLTGEQPGEDRLLLDLEAKIKEKLRHCNHNSK